MKKSTNPSFLIKGLAGQKTLKGKVKIHGAKNAALKAMAAAVLFSGKVGLKNIPNTADIETMSAILNKLGAKVKWVNGEDKSLGRTLEIDSTTIKSTDIDPKLAGGMRASVVLTGPLLARFGKVSFPAPGGCVIGARPIDLFIEGYKKLGATVALEDGLYHITAPKGLVGSNIFFHKISVGGTETLMMAATLAKGKTTLENCAKEPEIVNVAEWLTACGAKIKGVGTDTIEVEGLGGGTTVGGKLLAPKAHYIAIPDRIEAGSFLLLGALSAKELVIDDCEPKHLELLTHLLVEAGVPIVVKDSSATSRGSLIIKNNIKPNSSFKAFSVETHEYPGFPTDLQAQLVTFLTQVSGEGNVEETIFDGRFKYVEDLTKIGANITTMNPREVLIKGPTALVQLKFAGDGESESGELCAHDIRAGFAIVMAALVADGEFTVRNAHLIDRGYEKLEESLKALGADIKRVL